MIYKEALSILLLLFGVFACCINLAAILTHIIGHRRKSFTAAPFIGGPLVLLAAVVHFNDFKPAYMLFVLADLSYIWACFFGLRRVLIAIFRKIGL